MAKTKSVALQLEDIFEEYTEKVDKVAEDSADSVAQESAQKLQNTSPSKTGDYAKGWDVKVVNGTRIVYNATDWQLTHLLENGHDVINAYGRVGYAPPIKHIAPVERWANREFQVKISKGLK